MSDRMPSRSQRKGIFVNAKKTGDIVAFRMLHRAADIAIVAISLLLHNNYVASISITEYKKSNTY